MTSLLWGRPLLDTRSDAPLFVDRVDELALLERAVDARFNALVLGDRGSGKTSLLRALAGRLRTAGVAFEFVDAMVAADAPGLLDVIWRRVAQANGRSPGPHPEWFLPNGPAREPERLLRWIGALAEALGEGDPLTILLDGVPSRAAGHALFGRSRDELWQLPVNWVVAGDTEDRAELLRPPADAFFEQIVSLPPLSEADARRLLRLRVPSGDMSDEALDRVVAAAGGNPRTLIGMARGVLMHGEDRGAEGSRAALREKLAVLGRPAAMLAAELDAGGPASASDERLLRRLGWTRARAAQVLREMEDAGLVTASSRSGGGTGRPRKVYELVQP